MTLLTTQLFLYLSKLINMQNTLLLMTDEEDVPTQLCEGLSFPIVCSQYSISDSDVIANQIQSQTIRYNPILLSGEGHKDLILKLRDHPLLFSFNHVWVMPIEYGSLMSLRLDNNIIFYENITGGSYNIYDSYAIKGGRSITTKLLEWPKDDISLKIQKRALEGRSNLNGVVLRHSYVRRSKLWGYVLSIIQRKLNFTLLENKSKEKGWGAKHNNGTWSGLIGQIHKEETDIVSALMANLERHEVVDFCWPTGEMKLTLVGSNKGVPKVNIWAYVVFPLKAWIVGLVMFIVLSVFFSIANEKSLMQGFTLVMRLFLQMGYELALKGMASRGLLMTAALCLNIIFIYYSSDLTAKMTAEPQMPSIRSFDDVERLGYEVAISRGFGSMPYNVLSTAPSRSSMRQMYDDNRIKVIESDDKLSKLIQSDSKTLAFHYVDRLGNNVNHMDIAEAIRLRMSFAFKKGSEFSALFSHYLFKIQEVGIQARIPNKYRDPRNREYGMTEPIVLGYDNLFFPFGWLALGIVVAMPVLVAEVLARHLIAPKHPLTQRS